MLIYLIYLLACSPQEAPERALTSGSGGATLTQVDILSPADGETVANPVTFTVSHAGVSGLEISADGWSLGSPWETGQLTYEFTGVDVPRVVTLEGLDEAGEVIASDTITITATNDFAGEDSGGFTEVPYYSQYDNAYEPSSTCGLTSAAMMLGARGRHRSPDSLYLEYGKSQAQSPEGLAQLYSWEGFNADSGRYGTRTELRAMLDTGDPVVVHGFWTSAGHIVVLVGHDSTGWIVNDPAGDWYRWYGNGGGEAVRYAYGSSWDNKLSWDGDIWWSTAW